MQTGNEQMHSGVPGRRRQCTNPHKADVRESADSLVPPLFWVRVRWWALVWTTSPLVLDLALCRPIEPTPVYLAALSRLRHDSAVGQRFRLQVKTLSQWSPRTHRERERGFYRWAHRGTPQ